jgi:hypothetical protein
MYALKDRAYKINTFLLENIMTKMEINLSAMASNSKVTAITMSGYAGPFGVIDPDFIICPQYDELMAVDDKGNAVNPMAIATESALIAGIANAKNPEKTAQLIVDRIIATLSYLAELLAVGNTPAMVSAFASKPEKGKEQYIHFVSCGNGVYVGLKAAMEALGRALANVTRPESLTADEKLIAVKRDENSQEWKMYKGKIAAVWSRLTGNVVIPVGGFKVQTYAIYDAKVTQADIERMMEAKKKPLDAKRRAIEIS